MSPLCGARTMQLHVNPHALILIGENSFIRLSTDGGERGSTRCSHWRVLWTPAGAGHALFVDSGATGGIRIYADSVPLVRFLQKEIEYLLHKPFGDLHLPVIAATFERKARRRKPPASLSTPTRNRFA